MRPGRVAVVASVPFLVLLGVLRAVPFEQPGIQASWLDADRLPDPATLGRIDARRRADPALHA